jgi:hypothetical protein
MDMAHLVVALAPAFAAGFALQRLLEILDPIFEKLNNAQLKKILLGLISFAAGLGLAAWPKVRVLKELVAPDSAPSILDYLVTALIVSGGTEGFNSILKFLNYKKEETKGQALNAVLDAKMKKIPAEENLSMTENDEPITSNECIVWRTGEFRQRVRQAVAEWAQQPVESILPTNTLGQLAKGTPWNTGQQARLVEGVNAHAVFAPQFPNSQMRPPSQLISAGTTVEEWEGEVWGRQDPITPCLAFTN